METLGNYVHTWRLSNGLSQKELAELSGLSHGVITKLESRGAKPWPQNLEKLASAMNVDAVLLKQLPGGKATSNGRAPRDPVSVVSQQASGLSVDSILQALIANMSADDKRKLLAHILGV